MKNLAIKICFLFVAATIESIVAWPVFFVSLVLLNEENDPKGRWLWFFTASLLLAFFWQFSWWQAFVILYVGQAAYWNLQEKIPYFLLRLFVVLGPMVILSGLLGGIGLDMRSFGYSLVSLLLLLVSQRSRLMKKYQKKYL